METRITKLLGCKYPMIQGGMAWIAESTLASAVSNAGAVGLIAGGSAPIDYLREQIRTCKEKTQNPFGVNIMLMHPQADEFAKIVVEEGVPVVTTGAGNPGKYIPGVESGRHQGDPGCRRRRAGKASGTAGHRRVIAEGTESGGHVGEMTTMALVPQVVDAVSVPVIAAGGIADGRQLAAALALGACGVQVGTCLLAARSAPFTPTTRPRCSKPGTVTPSSPGAPWVHRCVC